MEELEEQVKEQDRRIQSLEQEVEDLKLRVCQCARVEEEIMYLQR